jgi:hypothetical protein
MGQVAKPAWVRGLDSCLQAIVIDRDDIAIERGEVERGELRAGGFPQLQRAFTDEQVLAFGWMGLADIACWPQLPQGEALQLAQSIQQLTPKLPNRSATARTQQQSGYRAAAAILKFISQAQARLKQPTTSSTPDFEPIRVAINELCHFRKNRVAFWEQWLRRVIESAAVSTPEEACACAVAALQHTLPLPARFEYEAKRQSRTPASNTNGPVSFVAAAPRQGGTTVMSLGTVTGLDPVKRKLNATFTPATPIDRYRMAYLIRSVCLSELFDDMKAGFFDSATFTNASTGEIWSYAAV